MAQELTLQAVSGITDPDQIRITLFINNQQVHAPLVDVVVVAASGTYLPLTGGTLTGALNGTTATFSGAVAGAAGTFTGLLTTNGQVAFPATQNPSANANTLDDYEEGTFTPALQFGGANVGITYTTQLGFYTKIGNVVFFTLNVALSSKGSSTGAATFAQLPFTSSTVAGSGAAAYCGTYTALAAVVGVPIANIASNSTVIALRHGNAATSPALDNTNFTNTSSLVLSGFYRTA